MTVALALAQMHMCRLLVTACAVLSCSSVLSAADDSNLPPADANGIIIKTLGSTSAGLGFTVKFPPGYDSSAATRWPVVFQLAGTGEQGDGSGDTATGQLYQKTTVYGAMKRIREGTWNFPVIVVAPQSPSGWQPNEINSVVDYALASWKVDSNRVYLTGLCQGGFATWTYAQIYQRKLAAICPIQASAGPGSPSALIDTPVWAFHSWGDWRFNRRNSINWIDGVASAIAGQPVTCITNYPSVGGDPTMPADGTKTAQFDVVTNAWTWLDGSAATATPLADAGKGVILTMYPHSGHGTWGDVWNGGTDQMWTWMFAQSKALRSTYGPSAIPVPGVVQAELFDRGLGSTVWQDSDRANRGGALRPEGVDIAPTTDVDGNFDVTDVKFGEFLSYTVNVTTQGVYDLALRVASPTGGRLRVELDGQDISGILVLPATGDGDTWATVPVLTTSLRTGARDIRLRFEEGGFKLNWFSIAASSASAVIVDNTTVGAFTTVGSWATSSGIPGFYGSNYAWATSTSATSATWTPTFTAAGYWQVYVRHPSDASRSPSVPLTITSDQGQTYMSINEQVEGGIWKYLGAYPFTPGAGQGVTMSTAGTTKYVAADSVMFVKNYQIPPIDLVVDNRDPARFSTVGSWSASTAVPGYYAADYAFNNPAGVSGYSATFRPTLPATSYYNVYTMYPASNSRSPAVPVEVMHAEGTTTVSLDQRTGSGWVYLGTWSFAAGNGASVTFRTDGTTGYVMADAVRFQQTDFVPPVDMILDNSQVPAAHISGLWLTGNSVAGFYGTNFAAANAANTGGLKREQWNVAVGTVAEIPVDSVPNIVAMTGSFEAPRGLGDNYCQRLSGWLIAPSTGSYSFWVAGDDSAVLRVSVDAVPANKVDVASVPSWTDYRQWTRFASQKSAPIALVAGRRYYVEALSRQGAGGDSLSIGWAKPGQPTTVPSEVIPGSQLSTSDGTGPAPTFAFRPSLPKAGIYEVYVQHPANSSRAPAVPVRITHSDGVANLILDERTNGGVWRLLGTYRFPAGLSAEVMLSAQGTTGTVCADAIRFKETSVLPPRDMIIDNLDSVQTERLGTWTAASSVAGYYASNYCFNQTLGGGSSFSWVPQLDRDGYFEVSIWHPADTNRDAAVQVEVVHADGRYGHFLDLTKRGGQWEVLGTFVFLKGSSGRVIMRSDGSSKYLMADAVRFREVDVLPDPQPLSMIVDNAWTAFTSRTGSWSTGTSVAGYFAGNYAWCTSLGVGGSAFTFTPDLPHPGTFNVWIRHSGTANRSATVPVDLITSAGTTTTLMNQQINNGVWMPLGTVNLPAGNSTSVKVRTDGTTGYVTADAVWFEEILLGGGG